MAKANSNTEIKTYFGQCKCCLNYAYLKNMWEQHWTEGNRENREIYGKMLVDCFSISWTIQEKIEDDKICEVCISRLRDAFSFKKQLLLSQSELVKESKANKNNIPEPDGNESAASSDDDKKNYEDVEFLEEEMLEEVNGDSQDMDQSEPETKKGKSKQETKKKHTYRKYTEEQLVAAVEKVQHNEMTVAKASATYNVPRKTVESKIKDGLGNDEEDFEIQQYPVADVPDDKDYILEKHNDNLQSVLASSNATPIKGRFGTGYACYFCPKQYIKPSDLKTHTSEHANLLLNLKAKCLNEHIVKLDVTALKCKICDMDVRSLDSLLVHMKVLHEMNVHLDIPNHLIPFRFDSDWLQCVNCPQEFDSFKGLSEHMNDIHHRNYECDQCPRGFVNRRSLRSHSQRHRTGVFVCANCPKVFDTKVKVVEHERVIHQLSNLNRKCNYCNAKFMDVVKRAKHEIEKHGVEQLEYRCKACSKVLDSKRALRTHVNGVHLMYKPHECNTCDSTFYLKKDLMQHMLKVHMGPSHKCSECTKSFRSYKALKAHMHKHSDDRKHECEVCRRRFQKEVNLLAHLKNKHSLER